MLAKVANLACAQNLYKHVILVALNIVTLDQHQFNSFMRITIT
jgi:hypothetical protein